MDGQVLMNTEELITQNYSSSHKAIDLVGEGHSIDDVVAISDGTVEIAVNTVSTNNQKSRGTASYGNYVKIRHDDGSKSLYAHMQYGSVTVKTGDRVSKGQKIGRMGNTGNAQGIHLHFEIRNSDDTRVNPITYLENKEEPVSNVEEVPVANTEEVPKENSPTSSNEEKTTADISIVKDDFQNSKVISENKNEENNYSSTADLNNNSEFLSNTNYKYGSIVDGLKGIGIDSSFDYRTELAHANNIDNYRGTYDQNVYLLSLLKQGKLKKA